MHDPQHIVAFEGLGSRKVPAINGSLAAGVVYLHRVRLISRYRERLAGLVCLAPLSRRPAFAYMPVLLPTDVASRGREVLNALALQGIAGSIIPSELLGDPTEWEVPSAAATARITEMIAASVLALPIGDDMTEADVDDVADALIEILAGIRARRRTRALGLSVAMPTAVAA